VSFDPNRHHRRSIRLQNYDYRRAGAYFVTLCTFGRECIFGEIIGEQVKLSPMGEIIRDEWLRTEALRPNVELDAYVIMPNHLHGIIVITDEISTAEPDFRAAFSHVPANSLATIIGSFKSAATRSVNRYRQTEGSIWQRNYWEHVIRNAHDLERIQGYIAANPQRWASDRLFPHHPS
jgi:REP element-mobilizing transposase RayT